MVFGDIVIVPFAVYIYLFPAVKIFEDLEDKGYIFKKNEKQNLKKPFLKNINFFILIKNILRRRTNFGIHNY